MILKGLPVDVERESSAVFINIYRGFDATDLVRKADWKYRCSCAERNARFVEFGLVESDIDGLGLCKVLGNQPMLHPVHKENEGV